ncbi:short chain dehydrogenase [Talaromyces proteolyticus]|uniref:Short chain dehydrogenase n=1 Tax=Talaromyces proteolyticus TaxID=1131652 RepID=A0AAD4KQS4_9EURO|nr:short chain dehydrogenase [Talaromyces proteolyticus]KAH8697048.1 short chain dehydrogenase [Talaromyces proteolyticus]
MPYSLKNRNVLVTGGSRGLGAFICERFAEEGCNVAVNYISNKERANQVAEKCRSKFGVNAVVLRADISVSSDAAYLVKETLAQLGGLDIIVHNAGWTRMADFGDINDLSLDEWNKYWDINVISQLVLMQEAVPIFNANTDGGALIITSSISGVNTGGSSMGYSVAKAAGLHLMKCLAVTQGPKIRINAVLPGLLLTEWGRRFGEERIEAAKKSAALKQETMLDDCADAFISIAKNSSMTGQQVVVDAGTLIR